MRRCVSILAGVGWMLLASASVAAGGQAADVRAEGEGLVSRDCNRCPDMLAVQGGSFTMGSAVVAEEGPQHTVDLAPFEVARTEIRFDEFREFRNDWRARGGVECGPLGRHAPAVVCVSWDDARAYAEWLAMVTGRGYRLPTEAEWEYVARRASELGLPDLMEGPWEWVEDCWYRGYEGAPADGSARVDGDCSERVIRAGSSTIPGGRWRGTVRVGIAKEERRDNVGFRVARTLRGESDE